MSKSMLLVLFLAAPASGLAAPPVVWEQVPDYETENMQSARLDSSSDAIDAAHRHVEAALDKKVADRKGLIAARHELRGRRADLTAARVDLWSARRNEDPARITLGQTRLGQAVTDRAIARDHIIWHKRLLAADHHRVAVSEAKVAVARARRERVEAGMTQEGMPATRLARFDHQIARMERVQSSREQAAADAQDRADKAHSAYLAAL